ncbi:Putative ribonuclease H protein At1g65750 [Linum perenne]
MLSLARRVTLALSVLNSIPSYAMQTTVLPVSVTNRIDAIIRNFVWGCSLVKSKIHLLAWDHICRPKDQGGLGLRKARELNQAYLIKLGWEIPNHPVKLWVRVVMSKYLKETVTGTQLHRKSGGSSLWKGIHTVWHEMRGVCQQNIRNGKDTLFWLSHWLDYDIILADHAIVDLSSDDLQLTVAEARNADGNWNWELLRRSPPPPPPPTSSALSPAWSRHATPLARMASSGDRTLAGDSP